MDASTFMEKLRRRTKIGGGGLLPLGMEGEPPQTCWILRRNDAYIRLLRNSEETVYELRAGDWRIKAGRSKVEVQLVAFAVGFGFRPFDEDDITVSFYDEHGEFSGMLEYLTLQDEVPFCLLGDTSESDITGAMRNAHRDWAKSTLASIAALPPWTENDFRRAQAQLRRRFTTKRQFWDFLGSQP
jgi:hypothetical protein